ncbi:MAG: hypothetical protein GY754_46390 [bacterium]|nr:hypothetical protein [bacterium]
MIDQNNILNWGDITKLYPDEWVLLIDYEPDVEFDGKGIIATKGRVLAHASDRKAFDKDVKKLQLKKSAIRYTGQLVPDN